MSKLKIDYKESLLNAQTYIAELERKNRLLGERCNQLLKDKGNLTDKIADIKENCDLAIEGRDVKIKELELELTVQKDQLQEETNLHLHAEEYIKSLEQKLEQTEKDLADHQFNYPTIKELEQENAELKGLKDVATLIRANNDTVVTLMQLNNMLVSKNQQLTKVTELLKEAQGYIENEDDVLYDEIEQFLKGEDIILEDAQASNSPFDADEVFNKEMKAYPDENVKKEIEK